MTSLTFAVDGWEWESLFQNPEDDKSPHAVREGMAIEAQMNLWPQLIYRHWNNRSPKSEVAYLGFDPEKPVPERGLFQLRKNSNLYMMSSTVRSFENRPWKNDPKKLRIDTLLDCGIPIVLSEELRRGEKSAFSEREGDFIVGLVLLFGSIVHSRALFKVPIIGTLNRAYPLKIVPPATLLEIELQPSRVVPEIRVSYHAHPREVPDIFHSDANLLVEPLF